MMSQIFFSPSVALPYIRTPEYTSICWRTQGYTLGPAGAYSVVQTGTFGPAGAENEWWYVGYIIWELMILSDHEGYIRCTRGVVM